MTDTDRRHMAHALSLAGRGLGRVWPNPAVGCVIVREGRVVGRGRTADGGRPHAERVALDMAGEAARGATAYVTLEPCAHHGKTPPCAEALVGAGLARVVIAHEDPDPRVAGQGIALLKTAGIEVTVGCLEDRARFLQDGFLRRVTQGRPRLTLKLALTLDGRIATASGESRWITGPEARHRVHAERAAHDAVLVGAGTARTDDPDLTVRGLGDIGAGRIRIVLSRHLRLPRDGRLFQTAGDPPVWLIHAGADAADIAAWEEAGARVIGVGALGTQVDLTGAFEALGAAGLTRVYCEGGGTLAAALMTADLVDELQVFSAGKLIGAEGRPGIGALGLAHLSEARAFRLADHVQLGEDIFHRWVRRA